MLIGSVVAACTEWVTDWVRLWAAVPGVSVIAPPPPLWLVLLALTFFALWAARRTLAISGHCIAVGLVACVVCAVFWHLPGRPGDGELRVRVLAVGDGAATIIRFPNGRAIVYDCGTTPPRELYRATLCAALDADRVRRLDAVVVSHPNIDHYSAVPELAAHVPIEAVWLTSHFAVQGSAPGRGPLARLMQELERRRTPIGQVHAGNRIVHTGGVSMEVLWPPPADEFAPTDLNDTSVVLRLRYGEHSILLTGDIEQEPQRWLMEHVDLRSDVLVLPHHGSVKPWTADFIRAVSPRYAIRSSGKRRELGPEGLSDFMAGYTYLNTADDGAVLIRLDVHGVRVSSCRSNLQPVSSP
jgi:competence protein ComEC